jgi:carbon starvation protein
MNLLLFLTVSAVLLGSAYWLVGRLLRRLFALSAEETTPAFTERDGLDYEPARMGTLLPQHLSAIAAAGPIVGPILAASQFGWLPAWLWILSGAVLVGGIHDFTALVASVRHRGRSIAEVVRSAMNPRAHRLFLIFILSSLEYVIIAFADVTAATFAAGAGAPEAEAPGPAVAMSSMLYLALAVAMGLTLRFTKVSPVMAKALFLPLVLGAIVAGPLLPLDPTPLIGAMRPQLFWVLVLLAYCFVAALAPLWSLLQPRGELGGWFLYVVMAVAVVGIAIGSLGGELPVHLPAFKGWSVPGTDLFGATTPLLPVLFITVACGACSGFHSIVATGTTSKQLCRETDAVPVAFGGMLIEGFLACVSLAALMVLAAPAGSPDRQYAEGIATFGAQILGVFGDVPPQVHMLLVKFALLCFATFVFDTLDACTRLARYVLMELLGWTSRRQAWIATVLVLALPLAIVLLPPLEVGGRPLPLWRAFWTIFGASNQLLAALTLLGLTMWLLKSGRAWWLTLPPAAFMMGITVWTMSLTVSPYLDLVRSDAAVPAIRHFQFAATMSLLALAVWLVAEAVVVARALRGGHRDPEPTAGSGVAVAG